MDLWKWLGENSAQLGAFATIITALIAAGTLLASRRESVARTRAQVIAYFDFAANSNSTVELVVANTGASIANDVLVEFSPPFADPETYPNHDAAGSLSVRFLAPLPSLAPNQTLRNPWWSATAVGGDELVNRYSTSDLVTVSITYKDGIWQLRRIFTGQKRQHKFELSVLPMLEQHYVTSSTSVIGRLEQIAKSVNKLANKHE